MLRCGLSEVVRSCISPVRDGTVEIYSVGFRVCQTWDLSLNFFFIIPAYSVSSVKVGPLSFSPPHSSLLEHWSVDVCGVNTSQDVVQLAGGARLPAAPCD